MMPRHTGILLRVGWAVLLMAAPSSAMGALVTEVLTAPRDGPGGRYPAYVELFYGAERRPFDFAVLGASPGRSLQIKRMVRVEPAAGRQTVVIHAGDWPTGVRVDSPRVSVPGDGLGFGRGAFGTAVRLVVFDGPAKHAATGVPFAEGTRLPGMEAWPTGLGVADAVAVSLDGGKVAKPGETHAALAADATLELDFGDAAYRWHDGRDYVDRFETGEPGERMSLDGGAALNPGLINDWPRDGTVPMPTPGAAAMGLTLLTGAGLLGRGRRRTAE